MPSKKVISESYMDKNEWNYNLNVFTIENTLNFEITKDNIHQEEVCLNVSDCIKLKKVIDKFIESQKEKKPKSKAGRKKIYDGESETLSIHVPSNQKQFIKSVVDAILKPMQIQNKDENTIL